MGDEDVYVDELGRRRIGPAPLPRPGVRSARQAPYVSPIWPPPGDPQAAHRPECGRDGRGCVCSRDVIPFPGGFRG